MNKVSQATLEIRDLRVSFAGHPVASVPELNVDAGEIVSGRGDGRVSAEPDAEEAYNYAKLGINRLAEQLAVEDFVRLANTPPAA